jgi:mono/diheme cytochrome c family protein
MRVQVSLWFAAVAAAGVAFAGAEGDAAHGASLYKTYCASCHGVAGKGDGPLADRLRYAPSDLTRLAKRAGGKFPSAKVYTVIDGRKAVKGHGGDDMPVWGDAFKASEERYDESAVRQRIAALVRHLELIQEK